MSDIRNVAILLATYNGEKYLADQIESIRNQTFSNYNVYMHDDGSNDKTAEILRAYCLKDDRFHLIEGPTFGDAKDNFFFLMRCIGNEEYIMFCDQDDYWLPEKIEKSLDTIRIVEKKTDVACIYSDLLVVDENLNTISSSFYSYSGKNPHNNKLQSLLMSNVVVGCTMMINRNLLNKSIENVDQDLLFMHDWWIALIAAASGQLVYINEPLLKYRQHCNNVVGAIKKRNMQTRIKEFVTLKNYETNHSRMRRSVNYSIAMDKVLDAHENRKLIHQMSKAYEHWWGYRAWFFVKNGLIPLKYLWRVIWL